MGNNFAYSEVTQGLGLFFFIFLILLGRGFKLLVSPEAETTANEGKLPCKVSEAELLIGS